MRKDIEIPEVKDVYIVAVKELHADYKTEDWNAYIINDGNEPLEMVLLVVQGYDDKDMTTHMRHTIKILPAKGFAKIEFMEESIFRLNNFYSVTYFLHNKMYEKRFEFPAHSIMDDNAVNVPVMGKLGVIAK
ncbi:hypothetical protein EAX61_02760 [Dokdonia sinensis]|uniref:Phenylalanyl-tRNA synthetase subunit alpha n=1 Tax=Dokdonia sinensis TaxID=2479847 RepID=A0A3M0GF18_9FLAO|nr:hypothetical protein [Dokdonia sinensis]RMB63330.1 hypothetical protein EAX61_02760 [Dokdonia sinensis]